MTQPKTLKDAQPSIENFLSEAKFCASKRKGFAAMLTVFPVILSVAEALHAYKNPSANSDDKILFKTFAPEMGDKSWLISSKKASKILSDHEIAIQLYHVRNSLAHQLSLPKNLGMVDDKSEIIQFRKAYPQHTLIISVVEFVNAVEKATQQIITRYPSIIFDPKPTGVRRGPAKGVTLPGVISTSTAEEPNDSS